MSTFLIRSATSFYFSILFIIILIIAFSPNISCRAIFISLVKSDALNHRYLFFILVNGTINLNNFLNLNSREVTLFSKLTSVQVLLMSYTSITLSCFTFEWFWHNNCFHFALFLLIASLTAFVLFIIISI